MTSWFPESVRSSERYSGISGSGDGVSPPVFPASARIASSTLRADSTSATLSVGIASVLQTPRRAILSSAMSTTVSVRNSIFPRLFRSISFAGTGFRCSVATRCSEAQRAMSAPSIASLGHPNGGASSAFRISLPVFGPECSRCRISLQTGCSSVARAKPIVSSGALASAFTRRITRSQPTASASLNRGNIRRTELCAASWTALTRSGQSTGIPPPGYNFVFARIDVIYSASFVAWFLHFASILVRA